MRNALALTILPILAVACTPYPAGDETKENGRISVTTSALDLSGISDACYRLEVRNSVGDVLWSKNTVCSSSFGDGKGAITYVGSCDAVNNPNEVSLTLLGISDASGAPVTDFTNPCPEGAACTQKVKCTENTDTPVDFNLTLMRDAQQGFFDVSVNIDSIACSAKLDCVDNLLTNPDTGERQPTAVLAFACTAGENAQAMRMSDITLDCDSPNGPVTITVDPSQGPGNYYRQKVESSGDPHEYLDQVASWPGDSSWSVGIAPDLAELAARGVTRCTLHAQATATQETDLVWSPKSNVYPYVDWSVDVVSKHANGLALDCGSHALNEPGSGVATKLISSEKHTKTGHVTLMK